MKAYKRKKFSIILITCLLLFIVGMPEGVFGFSSSAGGEIQEQHYIVGFDHNQKPGIRAFGLDPGTMAKSRLQDQILETYELIDGAKVLLTPEEASQLEGAPGIAFIEPDYPVYALGQTVPWGITRIYEDEAYPFHVWNDTKGGSIKVAVLDTGIQGNHADLSNLAGGCTTVDNTPWDTDGNGHGTHVAGIVAAQVNDIGVVGIAPEVSLYSVKVLDSNGKGSITSIISGIEWAVENGIDIISMSLGTTENSTSLKNTCDATYAAGHLLIAAAGNSGKADGSGSNMEYPAKYDSVIAVGATDSNNKRALFSSTGDELELMAPGDSIYSTYSGTALDSKISFLCGSFEFETSSYPLEYSGMGPVTGPAIFCGEATNADEIKAALQEKGILEGEDWVALIDRGNNTFAQKVLLAMGLGAKAAVIINNETEDPDSPGEFTLNDEVTEPPEEWIPAVSISYNAGQEIREEESIVATLEVGHNLYRTMSGTSMAAPHAAAAAAMIWAKAPSLTNEQVRDILNSTAQDLGLLSTQQGSGMIRLNRAVQIAVDVQENRVLALLDWRLVEGGAEADLELKAAAGTEAQVLCALYENDRRLLAIRIYPVEIIEYGQSLTATLSWDPLRPPATFKVFMTDAQFRPLGSCSETVLP